MLKDNFLEWIKNHIVLDEDNGQTFSTKEIYAHYCKSNPYAVSLTKFAHWISKISEFKQRKCTGRRGTKRFNGYSKITIKE